MSTVEIVNDDVAAKVLQMTDADITQFVRICIKDRALSSVVATLNRSVLQGAECDRQNAEKALTRLGFL
jgi:hypothetical protein